MNLLDKIFNWGKKESAQLLPANDGMGHFTFGRYSDNNKTKAKTKRWEEADAFFKDKKYDESIVAFFDYLKDDEIDNVQLVKKENDYEFQIYQGTKIVQGVITKDEINAKASIAEMPVASIPVMRRMLELNYSLFYTRYALQENKLVVCYDSTLDMASPNKLYYGLKELATKADKQDDLLLSSFQSLKSTDDDHIQFFSKEESEVKLSFFKKWIEETIKQVEDLNQDSFSGGIGYLMLTLIFKIDFLIAPEGKLLSKLEQINNTYWTNKEEKDPIERNQILKDELKSLLTWSNEEMFKCFYRAKFTFAATSPKPNHEISDSIKTANENALWYIENKYNDIAKSVIEYGLSYCQYSFSMPKPTTQLFMLFMQINHAEFFEALGIKTNYIEANEMYSDMIIARVKAIVTDAQERFPKVAINTQNLKFSNQIDFNISFLNEISTLNYER